MTFDPMGALFVVISIAVITVLIIVHEFGHFLAAKYFGFQTPVFGIGLPFGPAINLFHRWGTQFKFYFLLIGGFVSIPELGDESNQEEIKQQLGVELKPLKTFPVYQRAIVASGGIVFNILFAFLLTIVMIATIGMPHAIPSNTISGFGSETSAARIAGLQAGDRIVSLAGTQVQNGSELKAVVVQHQKQSIQIVVERKSERITKTINYEDGLGILLGQEKHYMHFKNPLDWVIEAFKFTVNTLIAMVISVIGLLLALVNKILAVIFPFIQQPVSELGEVKGIVGIVQLISQDIQANGVMIMEFAILLSLNLAVINLLPIPALDGGHLVFMLYEAIAGAKVSEKFQAIAIQAGLLFLLSIMALTTFNDIKNWVFS